MNFTFSGVFGLPKQQVLSSCPKHLCLGLGLCPLSVVFRGQVLRESGEERGLDLGGGAVGGGAPLPQHMASKDRHLIFI